MNLKAELPLILRKAAIFFARRVTGINRPVKEQRVHIEAFEECFDFMVKNGMVKEEFINVGTEQSDSGTKEVL